MIEQHLITPPPELVRQWREEAVNNPTEAFTQTVAIRAAQWGADQELQACCEWLPKMPPWSGKDLRKHRRPKPPSLKQQALEELDGIAAVFRMSHGGDIVCDKIRRALEALDG
jgi:hypothetical protein